MASLSTCTASSATAVFRSNISANKSENSSRFQASNFNNLSIKAENALKLNSSILGETLLPTNSNSKSQTRSTTKRSVIKSQASNVVGKPTILVAEKLGEGGIEYLKKFANVDCSYNLSPEELCAKISLCDALIVRSGTKVTKEVFEASQGRLKVVGRAGVGIDNVDLHAATEVGCLVVNAPTANTIAAAEHGIALMMAMARNVAQASQSLKAGNLNLRSFVFYALKHTKKR
jgi:D-3-phosphoglycerate dehydrogenase / 2-oxoglutarate reductase